MEHLFWRVRGSPATAVMVKQLSVFPLGNQARQDARAAFYRRRLKRNTTGAYHEQNYLCVFSSVWCWHVQAEG